MGDHLYPSLAKAIGEGNHEEGFTEHVIVGVVNDASCNMIEQIVTELRTPKRLANRHLWSQITTQSSLKCSIRLAADRLLVR